MTEKKPGIGKRIAFYLASLRASDEAPKLGDIMDALGLRTGTSCGERLREYRQQCGIPITCDRKTNRYDIPMATRMEIRGTDEYRKWRRSRA
jgi:hypothetical protein